MSIENTKVVDASTSLWLELGEPTDLSVPAIAYWLRTNIGALNNLISQNFSLSSSNEIIRIDPEDPNCVRDINTEEMSILKKMYMVHHYSVKTRENLGAASIDQILEITDDGQKIKKQNKNELSKTYLNLKRDENNELQDLVNMYRHNLSTPLQVIGDDEIPAFFTVDNDFTRINR